jgi:hypothetical protein
MNLCQLTNAISVAISRGIATAKILSWQEAPEPHRYQSRNSTFGLEKREIRP